MRGILTRILKEDPTQRKEALLDECARLCTGRKGEFVRRPTRKEAASDEDYGARRELASTAVVHEHFLRRRRGRLGLF